MTVHLRVDAELNDLVKPDEQVNAADSEEAQRALREALATDQDLS